MVWDLCVPKLAKIVEVIELTPIEKLFKLEFVSEEDAKVFTFKPGQFIEVSVFGVGEVPISICKSPTRSGPLELAIRRVGRVTNAIHKLKPGDIVGIRGPLGNGFPVEKMRGFDVLFVAGGLGMAPLRSVLQYVIDNRREYGDIIFLYGVRSYREALFRDMAIDMVEHPEKWGLKMFLSYEREDEVFEGLRQKYPERVRKGVVTVLFECADLYIKPDKVCAVIGGPPIMYRFVLKELAKRKIPPERIYLTLERRMKCGVGKCGHCIVGGATAIKYVCKDGPVFTYSDALAVRGLV
ncbi:MAG: FAD-binding oxidoreductase [Candidatus Nezhaarchaeota archaeon]|nr:FAD-binding oxidoreductase [Candidatus Nezhaarchaeota archaeon]MCX8141412.1 FAD-binding oxidoreductase [Candidatus Nezhaarchaeota archaeon]MDW8049678.1 FAD-binding oxidoreductase [Nitrososphaerota archaeon]